MSTPGVKHEMTAITPAAVFPIPGTPDWQVMTEDAVWVSNGPKNTVHRLDSKTNEAVAAIEVGKRPCSGLAAGFGSVWVPLCGDRPGYGERRQARAGAHRREDQPGGGDDSGGPREQRGRHGGLARRRCGS